MNTHEFNSVSTLRLVESVAPQPVAGAGRAEALQRRIQPAPFFGVASMQRFFDATIQRWLFASVLLASALAARAIAPADLQAEIASGAKITLVDVRATDLFAKGHIPGAINIPAALCPVKNLPPLGRVVVYDGGLGVDEATGAVAALNGKKGIKAEILDGGLSAWESLKNATTEARGVSTETLPMITYQQVKTNASDDLVLVDLRQTTNSSAAKFLPGATGQSLTDLQRAFPRARVTRSPYGVRSTKKTASGATIPPLLVLVDRGDGVAEQTARDLRASGVTRFVILAGGEQSVAREGQPGLQRSSTTATVNGPIPSNQ